MLGKLVATAVLVLLAAPALAAPLIDDIDNGGFESFTNNSPDLWAVTGGLAGPSNNADTGSLAVVMTPLATSAFVTIAQDVPNGDSDLPILMGTWYEFDFAAQLALGSGSTASADGIVHWKDLTGAEVRADKVPIAPSGAFLSYSVVLEAPLPSPDHPLPVTSATITFTLERASATDRHDDLLFVDTVAFGNQLPPLPGVPL
ncbi:MAG TPA: hypothetical protein VGR28_08590 [Candidatus Thermoplasmatota archaeon]|jgi:hypothetical protein|nr:hypothetical protein [Candidatus Thermoplasmatota archaeon]